jgi:hypothetical protein
MTAMLGGGQKGEALSDVEITSNCTALILGGAETISSALSGTTYYLTTNSSSLAKAVEEVRSAFSREEDITLTGTGQLKYLNAVITEALRMFPPFAGVSPRQVPVGGATIAGEFIPENVCCLGPLLPTLVSIALANEYFLLNPDHRWYLALEHDQMSGFLFACR